VEELQKLLDMQKLALIDAQTASFSSSAVNVAPGPGYAFYIEA
jgi:hypothetical protein